MPRLLPLLAVVLNLTPGLAAAPPAPRPTDHGPVLAAALEVAPGKLKDTTDLAATRNYVFRGRVIALDRARTVSLCFDTEHLRVAGAWIGKPVVARADKNMGPTVEGTMLFATRPGPGWARAGAWDDPRPNREGPLPHDWAHYRGLYLHGGRVVLSYSVGACAVLELPGCVRAGTQVAVTRTFKLEASARAQTLLVAEEPASTGGAVRAGNVAELRVGTEKLVAGLVAAPVGAAFAIEGKRLHLRLPPLPSGALFRLVIARLPATATPNTFTVLCQGALEDPAALTKGGPPRWPQTITTRGVVSTTKGPYVLDHIDLPETNPWGASVRFGGLDFFADGRAALCTWDGDVWIVSGLDKSLNRVTWKRFAAGLQQPLGLKIIDGVIHTAGRDQVTRLHDRNGDGEADFYENFNNDAGLTLQRHEFVMDLQTDRRGNLYYCRSGHYILSKRRANCCVYRLTPDGSKLEIVARGFREPNGMSIGPDGTMTVGDNEGNGIPQTPLYVLRQGADYGFAPPVTDPRGKGGAWKYLQKPLVWLPKKLDGSAGSQVWVTSASWGPLKGQLLHTSYGNCALYSVLIDRQAEPWQAMVWKFPLAFTSGIMRARFNPADGQLYLCGLRGWGTSAVKDGQFCRVRFTGDRTPIPVGFRVTKAGVEITFSGALDRKRAEDDENWAGDEADLIPQPGRATRPKQELPIESARLAPDGKTVTLTLERVRPASNVTLQYRLRSADGRPVVGQLHGTIHRVP